MISRRKFFAGSALAAGSVAIPYVARGADIAVARSGQKPGKIIHMVADGMSLGTLTCADYLSHQLRGHGLNWVSLCKQEGVRTGFMNMRSLNSMVTDSSAASSSWGSGSRVTNGSMNQLPNGKALVPLYTLFAQQGWKRGLVTTTEITHATPGGFAASVDSRDNGSEIAVQYLLREVDVLLGGGRKFFSKSLRKDKRDLQGEYSAAKYAVMQSATELAAADPGQRWLGIFSESHLPFMIDWLADAKLRERVPTLATMTKRALEWLGSHEHFILQIEGGRVDQGAHNCDAPAALREMLAFDDAVEFVLDFQKAHPDTLVVITTDHGNGNMGVNASGTAYGQSSPMFKRVANVNASFPEILRRLRQRPASVVQVLAEDQKPGDAKVGPAKEYVPEPKEIQTVILECTGYKVSERRAEQFRAFLQNKGTTLYDMMNSEVVQLGQLLANHIAVGWTGAAHTADYVPLTAFGPGSERFAGFVQNTDVFRHYTQLAGIDFKNPELPLMASGGMEATQVEPVREYAIV